MNIKALLTETTIEKTKTVIKGEFSLVEFIQDDKKIVTLKLAFTDISETLAKEIIELNNKYLK